MNKVLVILGATATGKSALAVKIARKFNGEIISADSRQVYKGLNIGTGKITKKEMRGIPHHLISIVSPKKIFSVSDWQKAAQSKVGEILSRGKLPIICGGTGFYIQSIVDGLNLPEVPPNKKLRKKLENKSASELYKILKKLDLKRSQNIDKNNKVRLVRAIEIVKKLGKVPEINTLLRYDALQIGLKLKDVELKKKINKRLISRMNSGMIKEAKNLKRNDLSFRRMRELGLEYRYLANYLEDKIPKKEMIEKLESEIWKYAKRQMTWFKRDKSIRWFKPNKEKEITQSIKKFLTRK